MTPADLERAPPGPIRILHLEDDRRDAELVAAYLAEGGIDAQIDRVDTPGAFKAAVERGDHALILSDYTIPGMDALEALRLARSIRPGVPYIFLSGTLGEERAVETLVRGATDYVLKDRLERLVPSVRRALEEVRERRLREQAQQELRQSEQRLRAMFENVALGITVVDAELRLLEVNERLCRILATPRERLLGRSVLQLTAPEDRALTEDLNGRLRQGALDVAEYEKRYLRGDGSPVWAHVTVSAVRDAAGRLQHAIGTVEDITERKRAEARVRELNVSLERTNAELREADRRKDEFIAMLSHELRNPLAPIQNGLYLLDRVPPGSDQARRAREIMGRQVKHLNRLVGDLLDVGRITRGKIQVQLERLDLCVVVARAVEDYRSLFLDQEVALEVEQGPGPIWISGDPTRLAQALGNLLQNAAKFTPPGGRVRVRTALEAGAVEVSVADTGIGIPPELMPRLFEPFAQADRSLARSSGGLGLGLALAKGLVELQGGEVRARSEGLGRGAEFTVRLPVEAAAEEPSPAPAARPAPGGCRVLVIEDHVDAAESLRALLEYEGHAVELARDGPSGLAAARREDSDVVLCDIGLPGMDGYAVARAMRADPALRSVYLVALTGYAAHEDVAEAQAAGFDRHLAKPPSIEALHAILEEAGRRARGGVGRQAT